MNRRAAHSVACSIGQRVCTHEQHTFDYAGGAGDSRRRSYWRHGVGFADCNAGVIGLERPAVCDEKISTSACRIWSLARSLVRVTESQTALGGSLLHYLGGHHVGTDTELLRFILTIFFDVDLGEVWVFDVMYRATNRQMHTRAGSARYYFGVHA